MIGNIGTSTLGGTGTNNYGAIFELNFEHSNELCLNDCDPNELTVSVYNSFNGENQCEDDAFDSTTQTVTVIDGSFLQDGDMPQYSNGKISKIVSELKPPMVRTCLINSIQQSLNQLS